MMIKRKQEEITMAGERNTFNGTVDSLFQGLDSLVSTKTVVGEAQVLGDVTIVPLVDVSFGVGAGTFRGEKKDNAGGGLGAKISPNAVLVIAKDGSTRLIRTNDKEDIATRIIDMAPGIISRFTSKKKPAVEEMSEAEVDEVKDAAKKAAQDTAAQILGQEA
jgi:uncharacterized spore protein YtfJ